MRIYPPDAQPLPFADLDLGTLRIYEVKLTLWVLLVKPPVALKSGAAIRAGFKNQADILICRGYLLTRFLYCVKLI